MTEGLGSSAVIVNLHEDGRHDDLEVEQPPQEYGCGVQRNH